MASSEVSINQLPVVNQVVNGDFLIVQTPNATNRLNFSDFVVGLDNTTFKSTIEQQTTDVQSISSIIGLATAGGTSNDGAGSGSGSGYVLSDCKETTVGSLKIKTGSVKITSTGDVDVTFPTPFTNNHLITMFVLKESAGDAGNGSIGDAGTRQVLKSFNTSSFQINVNNALDVTGVGQQYFYLSLGN